MLTDNPDDKSRVLIEMLGYSDEAENDLQMVNELRSLSRRLDAGVVFSRDRIGRASIMKDIFWSTAVKADLGSPVGQAVFEDCFACYDEWVFGRDVQPFSRLVRVFTDWTGNGKVTWHDGKVWNSSRFTMEPEIATWLLIATENSPLSEEKRALQEAVAFLDSSVATAFTASFDEEDEWRIHCVGMIGSLPLLAMSISGNRFGSNSKVAYRHPNSDVERLSASQLKVPELLILDTCFAVHSQKVKAAYERSIKLSGTGKIIQFNSNRSDRSLPAQTLAAELQSVSSAIIFSHVESPLAYAYEAGVVLGPTSRFKLSELASLNLGNLKELAIIGCASGRNNPFIGEATPAHAAAIAGASEIMFTLWPIRPRHGSRIVTRMLQSRLAGMTMREAIAKEFETNLSDALPFAIMRP